MRISELAAHTGIPLPTIKYYLREGLLMPGHATSATQAGYDDTHVRRLGLVRALAGQGLPLDRIRTIVVLVDGMDRDDSGGSGDSGGKDLFAVLGRAIAALPPYTDSPDRTDFPRARTLLERIGQRYDPRHAAVPQLERALEALDAAQLPMSEQRIDLYAAHVRAVAEFELGELPTSSRRGTVEAVVLGTVLYEPILAALRRLAHQHLAADVLPDPQPRQETP